MNNNNEADATVMRSGTIFHHCRHRPWFTAKVACFSEKRNSFSTNISATTCLKNDKKPPFLADIGKKYYLPYIKGYNKEPFTH